MNLNCPCCGSSIEIQLVESKIVNRTTLPRKMIPCGPGSQQYFYQEATPRVITWDCTNKDCIQRKGYPEPDNRTPLEKSLDLAQKELKTLLESGELPQVAHGLVSENQEDEIES